MQRIGRSVGNYIVENRLYRPAAMLTLEECGEQNIELAFITATPVDLAQGIYDSVRERLTEQGKYHLPEATIIGTEDTYHQDGQLVCISFQSALSFQLMLCIF